jgi:hypothetical protein
MPTREHRLWRLEGRGFPVGGAVEGSSHEIRTVADTMTNDASFGYFFGT